ncbi:gastric inhibitory polypeptide [Athene cunicularia]|uniref:gastric inhibitory polypeptide n=1 Tax=Athene cunicularia TaxID=194338 RepID=UPI000EF6A8E4|nr:gastric inhibitory polypeptide [Athene cunicularia]
MSFKVLSLLLASLGFVLMEENISGVSTRTPSARPVQRRYSEATLASDYSRTMDSMLKKNFVEWLLARREKKSDNIIEPYKREAEPQVSAGNGQRLDLGTEEAKDFFAWLLKAKKNQRCNHLKIITMVVTMASRACREQVPLGKAKYKERGTVLAEDQLAQVGD